MPASAQQETLEEVRLDLHPSRANLGADEDGDGLSESEKSKELRSIGEEAWNHRHEELATEWMTQAKQASDDHARTAKQFKKKHVGVGLPAILLPLVMAPLTSTLADEPGIEYANMSAFLVSGVLNAVHAFFGFDKKYQQHMDFSARYSALYTDIKYELTKGRRFRVSADEFLMRTQMKIDNLGAIAPDL